MIHRFTIVNNEIFRKHFQVTMTDKALNDSGLNV